jgi:hypothetical protein
VNSWKIKIANLITNATDVDGDTLVLTNFSVSTNGITLVNSSGYLQYYNTNKVDDQFSYTVADGYGGMSTANVTIMFSNSVPLVGQLTGAFTSFSNNVANLTFYGIPNYTYVTQRSTNLTDWVDIQTNTAATNGVINVSDAFPDFGGIPPSAAYYRQKYNQ